VHRSEFFVTHRRPDEWGVAGDMIEDQKFNHDLAQALRLAPPEGRSDLEVAIALAALVHEQLEAFGTSGYENFDDSDAALALVALRAVLKRLRVEFDPPYRNLSTFRLYWQDQGASNSYDARRGMLHDLFEPLHRELIRLEELSFDALATGVTPHSALGWATVDEEVRELRRRFQTASSAQDYRAVGGHCVGVLEALSSTVYDPAKHLDPGEIEPAVDKTKQRLERYLERSLGGKDNEELRRLLRPTIEMAQAVKHRPIGTRRDAGIAADATILLANMLRRVDEPQ
jgi:hypothetical protein